MSDYDPTLYVGRPTPKPLQELQIKQAAELAIESIDDHLDRDYELDSDRWYDLDCILRVASKMAHQKMIAVDRKERAATKETP